MEVNHNRTNTTFIDNQHTRSIDWTAQGRGTLTGVSLDVITATGEPQCLLQIDLNGTRFTEETTVLPDSAAGHWYTLPLAKTVPLQKGDRVKITAFRSSEFGGIKIYTANSSQLGCRLEITSLGAPSGTLTAVTRETGGTAQEALAWVRHSGGSVALSLNGAPMTAGAARSTQDLEGRACTEQAVLPGWRPGRPPGHAGPPDGERRGRLALRLRRRPALRKKPPPPGIPGGGVVSY